MGTSGAAKDDAYNGWKHRTSILFVCIGLLLLLPGAHARADSHAVQLTAQVDRHSVPLDEVARLTVAVEWTGPADLYRFGWPETPQTYRLSIVGSRRGSRSWVDEEGEHSRQEFTYILQPTETGKASVGAAQLTYWSAADTAQPGRTLMTMPISLEIVPPARRRWRIAWGDIALSAGVIGLVGCAVWWLRIRPRKARAKAKPSPPPPPDPFAESLAALARARAENDVPEFYGKLLQVVRLALARRLNRSTASMGAEELLPLLEETGWPEEQTAPVRTLLRQIDRRRFAPSHPEAWELEEAETTTRKLAALAAEERNADRSGN